MIEQSKAPSAQTLDCFIHAVSHLIDEFGFTAGIEKGEDLLSLISQVEPAVGLPPDSPEYRYRNENNRWMG